jgi:hypothetical protein
MDLARSEFRKRVAFEVLFQLARGGRGNGFREVRGRSTVEIIRDPAFFVPGYIHQR